MEILRQIREEASKANSKEQSQNRAGEVALPNELPVLCSEASWGMVAGILMCREGVRNFLGLGRQRFGKLVVAVRDGHMEPPTDMRAMNARPLKQSLQCDAYFNSVRFA